MAIGRRLSLLSAFFIMPTPTVTERLAAIEQLLAERLRPPRPLSSKEAARYLQISVSTLWKLTSKSTIPHYKSAGGKLVSFMREDLDNWRCSRRVSSVAEHAAAARRRS